MLMEPTTVEAAETTEHGAGRRAAPIDMVHLARQTFGSADLEREILGLFVAQSKGLVARIAVVEPRERAALVHRLKGSARGVGAVAVARICDLLEAPALAEADARRLIDDLGEANAEVRRFVDSIL